MTTSLFKFVRIDLCQDSGCVYCFLILTVVLFKQLFNHSFGRVFVVLVFDDFLPFSFYTFYPEMIGQLLMSGQKQNFKIVFEAIGMESGKINSGFFSSLVSIA